MTVWLCRNITDCIKTRRYRLEDLDTGQYIDIQYNDFKAFMLNKDNRVLNLKLSSDNRIIHRDINEGISIDEMYNASRLIYSKCKISGLHGNISVIIKLWKEYCRKVGYYDIFEYGLNSCGIAAIRKHTLADFYIDKSVILPYFVKSVSALFADKSFKKLDLRGFNTSQIEDMTSMFRNCTATHINLSTFDTSKVTRMSSMFYGCRFKNLDLHNFNTSKVKNFRQMFANSMIDFLDISNFSDSSANFKGNMFSNSFIGRMRVDNNKFNYNWEGVGIVCNQ